MARSDPSTAHSAQVAKISRRSNGDGGGAPHRSLEAGGVASEASRAGELEKGGTKTRTAPAAFSGLSGGVVGKGGGSPGPGREAARPARSLVRRSGDLLKQTRLQLALLRSSSADPLALVSLGARSAATRKTYRQAVGHFLEVLASWDRPLAQVDELDLLAYRELCQKLGLKAATINKRFCAIRLLLRRCVQVGAISRNPAARLDGLTLQTAKFGAFPSLSLVQSRQLLEACDLDATPRGRRDRLAFRLGLRTGLRVSEILAVCPDSLRQADGYGVLTVRAKGGAEHQTKLSSSLVEELNRFLELRAELGEERTDAPLFAGILGPSKSASGPFRLSASWSYRAFSYALRKRGRGAGIPFELTSHSLRATFITLALAAGAGLHRVQYAVGHESPRTTERYDTERRSLENHPTDYLEAI